MEIENHIFKESKYFKSPNFNDRPNSSDIRLLVIHSISLPPNNYGGDYVKDFFLNKLQSSEHEYFESIKNLKVSSHLFINRMVKFYNLFHLIKELGTQVNHLLKEN